MIDFDLKNDNSVPYENIVMPNADLPINFIEHYHNNTGPFCIMHWHNEIELVYVSEGVVSCTCDSNNIVAKTGDFIYINSNQLHSYSILQAPIHLYCNTIDLSILQGRYLSSYDSKFISPSQKLTLFKNHIIEDEHMKQYFIAMWLEHKEKNIGYEYAIKSNLYGIMSLLVRNHIKSTITSKESSSRNRSLDKINKVIKYIEKNYSQDISLDTLAELLGFTRFYFCRFFKETMGTTPVEYLNNFRVHQAISMMTHSPEFTIIEIAFNCGYNDPNYFAKVFRNTTGFTPSDYKWKLNQINI